MNPSRIEAMAESLFGCDDWEWIEPEVLGTCSLGSVIDRGDGVPVQIVRMEHYPKAGKILVFLNLKTVH